MKYGWAIWLLNGVDEATRCAKAAEMGLDFVSFVMHPYKWKQENPSQQAASGSVLKKLGLGWTVHCAFGNSTDTNMLKNVAAFMDEIRRFADESGIMPHVISFDPGYHETSTAPRTYDRDQTARGLDIAYTRLRDVPTTIALENWVKNSDLKNFEDVKRLHPDLGMLLDVGHLNIYKQGNGAEMKAYIEAMPLRIVDIHLHDNNGTEDQHLGVGDGVLPIADVCAGLKKIGYNNLVTCEVCPFLKGLDYHKPDDITRVQRSFATFRNTWQ